MLPAIRITQPTLIGRPFHRAGWIYEEKVDGWRMVVYKDGAAVKRVSRQGRDHTRRFPAIVTAIQAMAPPTLVLDGEVAVFDRALISRFEWLRHTAPPELATPPIFMAFDCLYVRGQDLRDRPLTTRRNVLEDALDGQDLVLPVRRLAEDGLAAWHDVLARGYEGLVAKNPVLSFVGERTLKWLEVKHQEYRVEERGWDPGKKS